MNKQDIYELMMGAAIIALGFIVHKQSMQIKQLSTQVLPAAKAATDTAPVKRQGIWAGDIGDLTSGTLGGSDGWRY